MTESPVVYAPLPGPQTAFCASPADIAIYGGAAGGGKSHALVFEPGRWVGLKGFAGIIFRRTFRQLTGGGSLWEAATAFYPVLGGKSRETPHLDWRFPAGATIQFAGMEHESTKLDYQGKQFAYIGFDEVTHFTAGQFWYLTSRLRSTCGVRPYLRATCNPDPDSWVKDLISWWIGSDGYPIAERAGVLRWFLRDGDALLWADSAAELTEARPDLCKGDLGPTSITFIPSKLSDNPVLTSKDPAYEARLMALNRVEREQLLGGNWNVRAIAGSYFQRSWFETLEVAPKDRDYVSQVRAWDLAATLPTPQDPDPDWTVGVKMGQLLDGRLVIPHVERMRGTPGGVTAAMKRIAAQDGRGVVILLWQDPGAAGKADADSKARELRALGYKVEIEVASSNKEAYAGPFSRKCEDGQVALVRGPWNEPFLKALEAFPSKTAHDDDVDACSRAFLKFNGGVIRYEVAAPQAKTLWPGQRL